MIQRVQTLYLLGTFGLLLSMFFSKFCFAPGEDPIKYMQYTPFVILLLVSTIVCFFTIFLYRHRMAQIRLCTFNTLILIAFQAWVAYIFFTSEEGLAFSVTALFPGVCAILTFVALRFIARDEAVVRAASSIRSVKKNRKRK